MCNRDLQKKLILSANSKSSSFLHAFIPTMNHELTSKRVIITGGSKGSGLACARTFLAEGARATLVSRAMENLLAAQSALLKETPARALISSPPTCATQRRLSARWTPWSVTSVRLMCS